MNKALSLSKTIKKEALFNSVDDVIIDVFNQPAQESGKKTLKLLTAHKKYLANIAFKDRVSSEISSKYTTKVLETDPELKITTEIVSTVYNAHNNEAKNSVISFFCEVVGEITFLNPIKCDTNVFRSILSSLGDNKNALPYLINELNKKFDKRLEGLKKLKNKSGKNGVEVKSKKSITSAQLKNLRFNVISLACLWAASQGKCTKAKAIDTLSRLISNGIDESSQSLSIESFLAANINSSYKKELGLLIASFLEKQQFAFKEKRKAMDEAEYVRRRLNNQVKECDLIKIELKEKKQIIDELQNQLKELQETIISKEQLEKAERVHLKDDTGKVKSKTINLLEEVIIPPLKTSLKALDRSEPKVKVAKHNIEVMIEEVEGALKWFKK